MIIINDKRTQLLMKRWGKLLTFKSQTQVSKEGLKELVYFTEIGTQHR